MNARARAETLRRVHDLFGRRAELDAAISRALARVMQLASEEKHGAANDAALALDEIMRIAVDTCREIQHVGDGES